MLSPTTSSICATIHGQVDRYYWGVVNAHIGCGGTGWGMIYMVAAIYAAIGRNALAVQYVNAIVGAATAPIVYLCALEVFNNIRVARISSSPSLSFLPSCFHFAGIKGRTDCFLFGTNNHGHAEIESEVRR